MLLQVYLSAAKVGVGVGVGVDLAGATDLVGEDVGCFAGVLGEQPATVTVRASSTTPAARRSAVERPDDVRGPDIRNRIDQESSRGTDK